MANQPLRAVHHYCLLAAAAGFAVLALHVAQTADVDRAFTTAAFWALACGTFLGELLPLEIPRREGDGEVTISTTFSFALLVGAGLLPAIAAQGTASVFQDVVARKPWWRIAFNVGQYALTLAASDLVLQLLHGRDASVHTGLHSAGVLPIVAAGAAFYAVNLLLVGTAFSLYQGTSLREYLRRNIGFSGAVGSVLLCLSPIVLTTLEFKPVFFPVFLILLLALHHGGRQLSRAARIEHHATHDALTGLPNRRCFRDSVAAALEGSPGQPGVVLLIDLDRFKEVNDTLGHHHGDLVLRQVSPRLRQSFREGDLVARLGGDEFAVFMPGVDSTATVEDAVGRFIEALHEPFESDGIRIELGASVGVALYPEHAGDVDALLQHADVAMYEAKRTHQACVQYSPAHDRHSHARLAIVSDLRRAFAQGELLLHYQPQVEIATDRMPAVEGLVRWNNPRAGLLPPAAFLEEAERSGLIGDLTEQVIEIGLADLRRWRDAGHAFTLSLNVSARSLLDGAFADRVARALARHGLDPSSLTLELTESSLMVDPLSSKRTMTELSECGVSLAIDDFGTGYSSLAYLTELAVQELKIDRSFVTGMINDPRHAVIVKSTIELAHGLGLRTVAEGVEDEVTLRRLLELRCHMAQGYHLSRPMPAGELVPWLVNRTRSSARDDLEVPISFDAPSFKVDS